MKKEEAIKYLTTIFLSFFLITSPACKGQDDTTGINKSRFIPLVTGINLGYAGTLVYLNEVWYKEGERTSFHFFNDAGEWMLMDKAGHTTTAFHESKFGIMALKWAGLPEKKAILWGSLTGFIYQTPIEWLDGYAKSYGASWADILANAIGAGMTLGQHLAWEEIRVQPKFSFHRTKWAPLRPEVLGKGFWQEVLKDYNGQTYWLSFNISSFVENLKIPRFGLIKTPQFINLSLGYSIEEMIYARPGINSEMGYGAYPQFFLSFDIDFEHVPIKQKWIKALLYPLNFIHIPFPALQMDRKGLTFHPIYF